MPTPLLLILTTILAVAVAGAPAKAMNTRKLDDTTTIKCGGCPCDSPCYTSPPPPPPQTPSPPPPTPSPPPPTPSPPPPPKKPSPTPGVDCPPPPSGGGGGGGVMAPPSYIYMTGPPGGLYPANQNLSGARRSFWVAPPLVVVCGLLGMLTFW